MLAFLNDAYLPPIMKPCPPPEGLTLPGVAYSSGERSKLMSLLENATIEHAGGKKSFGEDGGGENSLSTIRFENGSEAKVFYDNFWNDGMGGIAIKITYKFQQRMIMLAQLEDIESGLVSFELTEIQYRMIKKDLGLEDETTMSEFLAAIISRSVSVCQILDKDKYIDEEEIDNTPNFHQAQGLIRAGIDGAEQSE
jgi:hypothetical protein